MWLGKLTTLDMTPLGWLGRKTSTQTNKLLWLEPCSGHMWESQVLLTDGQVVFPQVLRFSPTFDERSARYKWNILERAVKPKSKNLIFSRKQDLTFHANCLQWRQFAWNVKICFPGKIRKMSPTCHLLNLPRDWKGLNESTLAATDIIGFYRTCL